MSDLSEAIDTGIAVILTIPFLLITSPAWIPIYMYKKISKLIKYIYIKQRKNA